MTKRLTSNTFLTSTFYNDSKIIDKKHFFFPKNDVFDHTFPIDILQKKRLKMEKVLFFGSRSKERGQKNPKLTKGGSFWNPTFIFGGREGGH